MTEEGSCADRQLCMARGLEEDSKLPAQKRLPTKSFLFETRYLILISRCALHLALFPTVCDLRQIIFFSCTFSMS